MRQMIKGGLNSSEQECGKMYLVWSGKFCKEFLLKAQEIHMGRLRWCLVEGQHM